MSTLAGGRAGGVLMPPGAFWVLATGRRRGEKALAGGKGTAFGRQPTDIPGKTMKADD